MSRKPLPREIETAVLVRARRRCAICFGLDRDTKLKSGQIAHLDKDNTNHLEGNLAFLCFEHHDEFDSRSSQRKNFTAAEVKHFRLELHESINKAFVQHVHFGEISTPPVDPYAGAYIRVGADSAELTLTPIPDSYEGRAQYYVSGIALHGQKRPYGPNMGIIEFFGALQTPASITYERGALEEKSVTTLTFGRPGQLHVIEDIKSAGYGAGVSFNGCYRRAG
jgi:hypothetical protein